MAQALKSSAFSRKIVNLFAGMAYGSPDLPRVFYDAGYRCHSIEQTFGVGITQQVNPEIMLCSDVDKHTLIVEAKSGANLNLKQLERYSLIDEDCLSARAFTTSASAKKHNVLIVGQFQWAERLLMGSAQIKSDRRVLAVALGYPPEENTESAESTDNDEKVATARGLSCIENSFSNPRLNSAFSPVLEVDWDLVPANFFPVDHEADDWEFAQFIIPELISAILDGKTVVRVDELAETFIHHWKLLGNLYRRRLIDRIRHVLKIAAQKRFSPYISLGAKGTAKNEVSFSIPPDLSANRAKLRSDLQKRLKALMDELNSPQIAMIYEG